MMTRILLLIGRGFLATLVAGILAGLVSSIAYQIAAAMGQTPPLSIGQFDAFIRMIALQLLFAAFVAVIVELPKTIWFSFRPNKSLSFSIIVNLLAFVATLLLLSLWDFIETGRFIDLELEGDPDMPFMAAYFIFIYSISFICSALVWWKGVILPMQAKRMGSKHASTFA